MEDNDEKIKLPIALLVTAVIMILSKLFLSPVLGIYRDRIFTTYLIFGVSGCYMGANYEFFKERLSRGIKTIVSAFSATVIFEAALGYISFTVKPIVFVESVHFVYCICAVIFCISLSFYMGEKIMKSKILSEIDSASYYIYLAHPLFILFINKMMTKIGLNTVMKILPIRIVFVYVASISFGIIYTQIRNRILKRRCFNRDMSEGARNV